MTSQIEIQQLLTNTTKESNNFVQLVNQIEEQCHNCKPLSPMSCMEQCEIWKMKNEFLQIGKILCKKEYRSELFNAIKNVRRLKILNIVSNVPCNLKELQRRLKNGGYYHSIRTISKYLEPLMSIGLVKKEGDRYTATVYGKKVNAIFREFNMENALPMHSGCYEESVLIELLHGAKTFEELAKTVPSLSRVMGRLQEEGLIITKKSSQHIYYFKTQEKSKERLSPTEKRILETIMEDGISARKLSRRVCINLRRTYKYLRRLKEKQLIYARDLPKTYKLTKLGRQIAKFLDELARFISTASNFSALNKIND